MDKGVRKLAQAGRGECSRRACPEAWRQLVWQAELGQPASQGLPQASLATCMLQTWPLEDVEQLCTWALPPVPPQNCLWDLFQASFP